MHLVGPHELDRIWTICRVLVGENSPYICMYVCWFVCMHTCIMHVYVTKFSGMVWPFQGYDLSVMNQRLSIFRQGLFLLYSRTVPIKTSPELCMLLHCAGSHAVCVYGYYHRLWTIWLFKRLRTSDLYACQYSFFSVILVSLLPSIKDRLNVCLTDLPKRIVYVTSIL